MEIWKDIPGYEGRYEVSSFGRVRSLTGTPKILRQSLRGKYPSVTLAKDGSKKSATAHSLVCLAFYGPRPEKHEVMHLDGDPTNNAVSNLSYGTASQNQRMRADHGTAYRGADHHKCRLTENEVYEIRAATSGIRRLGAKYGVSRSTIEAIRARRNWGWLPEKT